MNLYLFLAHGESWDFNDQPNNGRRKITLNKLRPSSTRNHQSSIPNINRSRSRSQSNRRSKVKLRSDVSQTRPHYSTSQTENNSQLSQKNVFTIAL
jgi:hypothetical protein